MNKHSHLNRWDGNIPKTLRTHDLYAHQRELFPREVDIEKVEKHLSKEEIEFRCINIKKFVGII